MMRIFAMKIFEFYVLTHSNIPAVSPLAADVFHVDVSHVVHRESKDSVILFST